MTLRFEEFADAPSAQTAFEAAFPPGSPAEPALQALVNLGAQCKSVGPGRVVCRYAENRALVGWWWHLAVEASAKKAIERVRIALAMTGP
jgi:hypothetical protein